MSRLSAANTIIKYQPQTASIKIATRFSFTSFNILGGKYPSELNGRYVLWRSRHDRSYVM